MSEDNEIIITKADDSENESAEQDNRDRNNSEEGPSKEKVDEIIKVTYERISDVPEKEQIKIEKDPDTVFRFSCEVDKEKLIVKLSEIGALCPFIYRAELTMDELREIHSAFVSCECLEEIKKHLDKLFEQKNIKLPEKDDGKIIVLKVKIFVISQETEIEFKLRKLMTTEKDKVLEELYEIQKKGNKIFKDMEIYLKKKGMNDVLNKFFK